MSEKPSGDKMERIANVAVSAFSRDGFHAARTPGKDCAKVFVRCLALVTGLAGIGVGTLAAQSLGGGQWAVSSHPPDIMVAVGYATDAFAPVLEGRPQQPTFLDNLDLLLHLNLKALPGLRGTSIRVHVQSNRGESVSSEEGALQEISNLEAPKEWRLYEAWIEHQVSSPRIFSFHGPCGSGHGTAHPFHLWAARCERRRPRRF